MATITVLVNQSLLDIAIKTTGQAENAILIAIANNISITDNLQPGTSLIIPEITGDYEVKNYFDSRKLNPATAVKDNDINYPEGIGYWEIEKNFKVQ
ncbi:hypothetical protein [Elizabethkingia anophelis]|uniref:hypothetical protein n=1 Tax=Elizabethkingia anophelis TaxID=1117645 RepID=UPI0038918B82|nr:hypothetical protein [Elizabethkingia anophelis]